VVEGAERAREAARRAGGEHRLLDVRGVFEKAVLADFEREYARGRTPNPCVRCNTHLKWGFLIAHARQWGAEWFATGHHARIDRGGAEGVCLRRGLDQEKDQTYALWGIPYAHLARTLLPIGELTKTEVRRRAEQYGLAAAAVPDSQEICFVPGDDYRAFLERRLRDDPSGRDDLARALTPGPIVDTEGRQLGLHGGTAHFTIGQRRGLAVAAGRRLYVEEIEAETRTVRVGGEEGLLRDRLRAEEANWLLPEPPSVPFEAQVCIRYNSRAVPARIEPLDRTRFAVSLREPQRAVTPGQSVVVYQQERVLGGGVIAGEDRPTEW